MAVAEAVKIGKVVQVIGPVVDIEFPGSLPSIYNAVRVTGDAGGQKVDIIVEVEQHLGENRVRTVAMKPTDGLGSTWRPRIRAGRFRRRLTRNGAAC